MARKARERKGYFYENEEAQFVNFIKAETQEEKDKIFNKHLRYPFTKLVESIIRRYKLYPPDETYEETFNDTMSFLITKSSCFKPESNFKAYSYLGTIAKNYLIFKLTSYTKNRNRNIDYDVVQDSFQDNIEYSYNNPLRRESVAEELIEGIIEKIDKILESKKDELTVNERKVGYAMRNLFSNWTELFVHIGSNKFNKSSILLYLKEATLLPTKEIREASKRYKNAYLDLKAEILSE